jgi:hypothetical protein
MTISQSAGHPSRTFYRRHCMTHAGETIENPVTHDRVIFRLTAQDTKGTLLAFDDVLLVGYISPPEHVHPRQEERFEVISGSLAYEPLDATKCCLRARA